ncbi:MAG: transketolase [Patescibacteria group bacterium]|nr:transketolase [Patescibacteria group bacterium]
MDISELKKKAAQLRIDALTAIHKANSGHTGGSMSCMDLLVALYYGGFMKIDSKRPHWDERDFFVLSKGHAAPAIYAILADLGFFDKSELDHLRQVGALLQGHPVVKIPGIEATTGSLGQGISVAVGLALACKLDREDRKVFTLLGDGELQEGQVWEAVMSASHYRLDNLIAFVDKNNLQIDGTCKSVMNVEPIADKFESFGWKVIPLVDGHDLEEITRAIEKAQKVQRQPVMILAPTVKGKGVEFAEGKVGYHGVALSQEEMSVAIPVLQEKTK